MRYLRFVVSRVLHRVAEARAGHRAYRPDPLLACDPGCRCVAIQHARYFNEVGDSSSA